MGFCETHGFTPWTSEEESLLREVSANSLPIKASMHLFPGRTHCAVVGRMARLGLKKRAPGRQVKYVESLAFTTLRQTLQDHGPLDCKSLARVAGVSYRRAHEFMKQNRAQMHVASWTRDGGHGYYAAVWKLGAGEDAARPVPITKAEMDRRAALKRKLAKHGEGKKVRAFNPFAAALGLVEAPKGESGRVYIHLTDKDDEYAEAA